MKRVFLKLPDGTEIEYQNTANIPAKGDTINIVKPIQGRKRHYIKEYNVLAVRHICIQNSPVHVENYSIQIDVDESH